MEALHLDITGMSCGHCVDAVRRSLTDIAGVSVQQVAVGNADVHFDPTQISRDAIVHAVSDAGYPARPSVAA